MRWTRVVPWLLPHRDCGPLCPYCPVVPGRTVVVPEPPDVEERLSPTSTTAAVRPVELGIFGGDALRLPRSVQDGLFATTLSLRSRGSIHGLRVTTTPPSVNDESVGLLRRVGADCVELAVQTLDPKVRRTLGEHEHVEVSAAIDTIRRAGLRVVAHLCPGLPGASRDEAERSAKALVRLGVDGVRVLPALALVGARSERWYRQSSWAPPTFAEATDLCARVLEIFRGAGVPVIRLGLNPETDLFGAPTVLAGAVGPGLRAAADSPRLRVAAIEALLALDRRGVTALALRVHPKDEAALRGTENVQLREIQERAALLDVVVVPDADLPRGEVLAERAHPRAWVLDRVRASG